MLIVSSLEFGVGVDREAEGTSDLGMEIPDRQFESVATSLASYAFSISTILAVIFMALLQYLLFEIHCSRQNIRPPTSLELCLIINSLWIGHNILDYFIGLVIDNILLLNLPASERPEYYYLRCDSYNLNYWAGVSSESSPGYDGIRLLFYEVLTTWLISQSLILLLDIILPLFRSIRLGNQKHITAKLQTRALELLEFIINLHHNENSHSSPSHPQASLFWEDSRSASQTIKLFRLKSDIPEKGQRALSWDLTVDKAALDEMKETLGPPGGFGELGFNVAADRVCFGAMGIGTRFELTFVLNDGMDEALKMERQRKSS